MAKTERSDSEVGWEGRSGASQSHATGPRPDFAVPLDAEAESAGSDEPAQRGVGLRPLVEQLRAERDAEHLHFLNTDARLQEAESELVLLRQRDAWLTQAVQKNGPLALDLMAARAELDRLLNDLEQLIKQFKGYRDAPMTRGNKVEIATIRKTLNVVVADLEALREGLIHRLPFRP